MKYNKKAQIFLLAAVIVVAIILSIGGIYNYASTRTHPSLSDRFYNDCDMIKKEVAHVEQFCIYSDVSCDAYINDFMSKVSKHYTQYDIEYNSSGLIKMSYDTDSDYLTCN